MILLEAAAAAGCNQGRLPGPRRWLAQSWAWWGYKVLSTRLCLDFLATAFLILTWQESKAVSASAAAASARLDCTTLSGGGGGGGV